MVCNVLVGLLLKSYRVVDLLALAFIDRSQSNQICEFVAQKIMIIYILLTFCGYEQHSYLCQVGT